MAKSAKQFSNGLSVEELIAEGTPCGNKIHITLPDDLVRPGQPRQISVYPHEAEETIREKMRQAHVSMR